MGKKRLDIQRKFDAVVLAAQHAIDGEDNQLAMTLNAVAQDLLKCSKRSNRRLYSDDRYGSRPGEGGIADYQAGPEVPEREE